MRFVATVVGFGVMLAAGLAAPTALAQQTEGAFQLGLSTSVLSYTDSNVEIEQGGIQIEADSSVTRWGLADNPVSLELGYGLTELLILGGFVQLGGSSTSTEFEQFLPDVDESMFLLTLGPKLDFIFLEGKRIRPFATVGLGLAIASNDDGTTETSLTGFGLRGGGGIRAFVTDTVSLDPALILGWNTLSGDVDSADGTLDADASSSGFSIAVALGLSAWID